MQEVITHIDARAFTSHLTHGLVLHHTRLEGERLLPVVRCGTATSSGFGEAPPLQTFTHETAADTVANIERLAPTLTGQTPRAALDTLHTLDTRVSSQTRAALDIALHDLIARDLSVPVNQLLGPATTAAVRISRAIGLHSLERTVDLARGYVALGITALKLKVGRDTDIDAAVIHAVRNAVGPKVELAIDANEGLTVQAAQRLVDATREAGLAYFEQPVPRSDYQGLRAVREAGLPILADESLFTAKDAQRLLEAQAADIFAVKLIKCGGLRPALEIVTLAEEHGIPVIIIDPLGSGVSLNAGLHLAAVLTPHRYAHGLSAGLDVTAHYAPHLPIEAGHIMVPTSPGLGAEVIWPLPQTEQAI
jgi:L-alanine-DL-glutamate epimerase-like enolase superfamily enzyme